MAIAAACTALSAYLIGNVINQAYVNRNLAGIITLGVVTVALFAAKGARHLRPQRDAVAHRQPHRRRQSARACSPSCSTKGSAFFSDRHSTEFIARLSTGAAAATQVLNLLITSLGRDLFSLIGLVIVMVMQDPMMSFFGFVVAPPAFFVLRKLIRRIYAIARTQFHGSTRMVETCRRRCRASASSRLSRSKTSMRERFDAQRRRRRARSQQDGARVATAPAR